MPSVWATQWFKNHPPKLDQEARDQLLSDLVEDTLGVPEDLLKCMSRFVHEVYCREPEGHHYPRSCPLEQDIHDFVGIAFATEAMSQLIERTGGDFSGTIADPGYDPPVQGMKNTEQYTITVKLPVQIDETRLLDELNDLLWTRLANEDYVLPDQEWELDIAVRYEHPEEET